MVRKSCWRPTKGERGITGQGSTQTPPEQVAERKEAIKDVETKIVELEKVVHTILEEVMQFLGSMVHDEQLYQLKVQLGEA